MMIMLSRIPLTVQFKLVSKSYLKEAEWFSQNYTPSFKEHIDFSITSTGLPMLSHVALMGAGQLATKEAFDWALDMPDLVKGMAETGRFFNDISSYYKVLHIRSFRSKMSIYNSTCYFNGSKCRLSI
jgi:hypothetical protein